MITDSLPHFHAEWLIPIPNVKKNTHKESILGMEAVFHSRNLDKILFKGTSAFFFILFWRTTEQNQKCLFSLLERNPDISTSLQKQELFTGGQQASWSR